MLQRAASWGRQQGGAPLQRKASSTATRAADDDSKPCRDAAAASPPVTGAPAARGAKRQLPAAWAAVHHAHTVAALQESRPAGADSVAPHKLPDSWLRFAAKRKAGLKMSRLSRTAFAGAGRSSGGGGRDGGADVISSATISSARAQAHAHS
jgi:hypothetical protein